MGVKFLSLEWAEAATEALGAHAGFSSAIARMELALQFEVVDPRFGSITNYYVEVAGGVATIGIGTLGKADLSVTTDYAAATAISKGDLSVQTAFFSGKLKVVGNFAKLMLHQAALGHLAEAVSGLEVDY